MMTHPVPAASAEPNTVILMDEERFFQSDVGGADAMDQQTVQAVSAVSTVAVQVPVQVRELQDATMSAPKSP